VDDTLQRFAMSEVTTYNWTFEQDVTGYARAGWAGIGVWQNKLEGRGAWYDAIPVDILDARIVDRARRTLTQSSLRVSSLICAGDYTYTSTEERGRRVAHTVASIDVARQIGADCLLIVPGPLRGLSHEHAAELVMRSLVEALRAAEQHGVRLAIEPLHERHTDFINTLSEAQALVEEIDHPLCGLFLDTYHLWQTDDLLPAIERAAGRIFGVHVVDSYAEPRSQEDRLIPGDGVIPLREIVGAVERTGYDGLYEVEIMSDDLWASDYDHLLERCRAGLRDILCEES